MGSSRTNNRFTLNATGNVNLLEMPRLNCPEATFIFSSTNKVYGDIPNYLLLIELEKRWKIDASHVYFKDGIDKKMIIIQTKHSLFGASKVASDISVQEFGKYFGMNTSVFPVGCLTKPNYS